MTCAVCVGAEGWLVCWRVMSTILAVMMMMLVFGVHSDGHCVLLPLLPPANDTCNSQLIFSKFMTLFLICYTILLNQEFA